MPQRPKTVTSLRIDQDLIDKMKYIGWYKRSSFSQEITNAVLSHINEYEAQNGTITAKQLKEAGIVESK